jgi:galactokinase
MVTQDEEEPIVVIRRGSKEADFAVVRGRPGRLFRAPGRVNLIGEHTDYNDGFVMPVAIDRATWVAAAPRSDRLLVVTSDRVSGAARLDLDRLGDRTTGDWTNYVAGVAAVLDRQTRLAGADLAIHSDVPIGAGLSSSAALEVACAYALLTLASREIDLTAVAQACQLAEHEFVGTRCGIMDQFIACHGRAGSALMLDTRSLDPKWLPLAPDLRILACNTMVSHQLASAGYNERRADCETGVRLLAPRFPNIRALRDVTPGQLEEAVDLLPERVYRRCRHVVLENARVLNAAAALEAGDAPRFGRLMYESHESLRRDHEVSSRELDIMVDAASDLAGVYGARMTGGGFGGCTVALVDAARADEIAGEIRQRYEAATGLRPDVWICAAGDGVGEWTRE